MFCPVGGLVDLYLLQNTLAVLLSSWSAWTSRHHMFELPQPSGNCFETIISTCMMKQKERTAYQAWVIVDPSAHLGFKAGLLIQHIMF